jgi:hypothetical protein
MSIISLNNNNLVNFDSDDIAQKMFKARMTVQDTATIQNKALFLQEFLRDINSKINSLDNEKNLTFGLTVASVGGSLGLLLGVAAIPIVNLLVVPTIISSGIFTLSKLKKDSTDQHYIDTLMRYQICLAAESLSDWAKLWHCCDTDIFIRCLYEGTSGDLIGHEIHRAESHMLSVEKAIISVTGVDTSDLFSNLATQQKTSHQILPIAQSLPVTANVPLSTVSPGLTPGVPNLKALLSLSLPERAMEFIKLLDASGFEIARCIQKQVTVVAGSQRGGKGTLMGLLAILSSALNPATKVHYFTAGDDVYPFKCDRLVSAKSYPYMEEPDKKVASELINYLRDMERGSVGQYNGTLLVLDEAVALGEYIADEDTVWMVKFLLTRAAKKGARIFIVLHGNNLTSWTGTGKTGGFSATFKSSAAFVGCESRSIKVSPLETIDVATGKYFLADPDNFGAAISGGEIGTIPAWLLTEKNPLTGQPDPVRGLLKIFPELNSEATEKIPEVAPSTTTPPKNSNIAPQHFSKQLEQENFEADLEIDSDNLPLTITDLNQNKSFLESLMGKETLSLEAQKIYSKLLKKGSMSIRELIAAKPMGREGTHTVASITYFLGELILVNLVKEQDGRYIVL